MTRFRDLASLHPLSQEAFRLLAERLYADYESGICKEWLREFETWRSPIRQLELLREGKTKAAPWQSAHQYGMAVDFVPFRYGEVGRAGTWTWDVEAGVWDHLRKRAHELGLACELDWDRCHVEHPEFREWLRLLPS